MARTKETELVKFAKAELKKNDQMVIYPYVMTLIKAFNKFESTDYVKREIVEAFAKLAMFKTIRPETYQKIDNIINTISVSDKDMEGVEITMAPNNLEKKLLEEADMEIDNS
jgi:hypothetical protein